MKNEKIKEKCFLDLVREFEELKEVQSESEGGGVTIQDFQVTINRDYIQFYFLLGMSVLLGWLSQLSNVTCFMLSRCPVPKQQFDNNYY